MKKLALLLFLSAASLSLPAADWLENSTFQGGIVHWYGNGQSPADFTPKNPFDKPDPFTSKGLIVSLKGHDWRKVSQDFKGTLSGGVLTITYQVSPDLKFSTKLEDYQNMPGHIGFNGWKPFDTPAGEWVIFISDFGSSHGIYYVLKPDLDSSKPQTIKAKISGLTPHQNKTITLAFPPGTGTIVFTEVSLTDN